MSRPTVILLVLAALAGAIAPSAGRAQQRDTVRARQEVERRAGRNVSQAEIIERLRQSGMTRSQVRTRLQQLGYDPGLADRYFDIIESGGEPPRGDASAEFLTALGRIGVVARPLPLDSLGFPLDSAVLDSLALDTLAMDTLAPVRDSIFGREIFRGAPSRFQADLLGPVDPSYRVGPGDELMLILTGDVELAYDLQVSREGFVVVPDAGQVNVAGLTLADLGGRLRGRLARVYSGVESGATNVEVSLGRLRNILVYIIGEVERPGAYQVSGGASVFNALYQARGPSDVGSFRAIEVRRGERVIATVDLYDYLVLGDSRGDIRLEHGDIVFVPVAGPRVRLDGAVRRPAIFELEPGDGLRDVVAYAGGFEASAHVQRIQIDRILPATQRQPGRDRVLVDVDLGSFLAPGGVEVPVRDGDLVSVFSVSEQRRNRVSLTGDVRRPGLYEWRAGMTVADVIGRADGLAESAYTARAHIYRLVEADGTRRMLRVSLDGTETATPLADLDSVVVFSREELTSPSFVTIDGFVKDPGTFALAEGMTLKDLILAAGGFIHGAYVLEAEVARTTDEMRRTDRTAEIVRVPLDPALEGGPASGEARRSAGGPPEWRPGADEFELRHADHVYVRRAPGYELPRRVILTGEVLLPGTYVLESRQERLLDLLTRAGGLAPEAYGQGLQLVREGSLVATDLERAQRDRDGRYNIVLAGGDSLHVPPYDPTVRVLGAVAFESRVLYRPGSNLEYYVRQAGGYLDNADRDRVAVTYQDGERSVVRKALWMRLKPEPGPGSSVFVPAEVERVGVDWGTVISATTAVLTATATVIIAVTQLR